jgi:hypothetical protein
MHYRNDQGQYLGYIEGEEHRPEGGIVIETPPLRASDIWQNGAWVANPNADPLPLSAARFEWLLAYTGLDDVWAALEGAVKAQDRAAYASIRAQRAKRQFHLDKTLAMVAQFRPVAAQIAPDADLSDNAIRAAWKLAEGAEL